MPINGDDFLSIQSKHTRTSLYTKGIGQYIEHSSRMRPYNSSSVNAPCCIRVVQQYCGLIVRWIVMMLHHQVCMERNELWLPPRSTLSCVLLLYELGFSRCPPGSGKVRTDFTFIMIPNVHCISGHSAIYTHARV